MTSWYLDPFKDTVGVNSLPSPSWRSSYQASASAMFASTSGRRESAHLNPGRQRALNAIVVDS